MNEKSVEEIYATNAAIREKLKGVVSSLSDDQANHIPEGEKWSVANIVEHLTMVEGGATRICAKLLSKAKDEGKAGNGMILISDNFVEKGNESVGVKLEAPDFVKPVGGKSISESLGLLDANAQVLNDLKNLFETVDPNEHKFPHPYFGGLSAGEWLTIIGGHEARHLRQIKGLLEKV
jgi:hypothetical protein